MKTLVLLVISVFIWVIADCIFDNHIVMGTAPWWREIWIFAASWFVSEAYERYSNR